MWEGMHAQKHAHGVQSLVGWFAEAYYLVLLVFVLTGDVVVSISADLGGEGFLGGGSGRAPWVSDCGVPRSFLARLQWGLAHAEVGLAQGRPGRVCVCVCVGWSVVCDATGPKLESRAGEAGVVGRMT